MSNQYYLGVGKEIRDGRYIIRGSLGKGGFGTVFEVEENGKQKAIKVLLDGFPKAVIKFQEEADVLNKFKHPGIVKVEKDGYFNIKQNEEIVHCLVMEKVPGDNLERWFNNQNKNIDEAQALKWLFQLVDILDYIHHGKRNGQTDYFHRDINPRNIMVKPDGNLVLIDFGVIREISQTFLEKENENIKRTSVGTPEYSPHEQIIGLSVPQSDFYALGYTIIYLLTGKPPQSLRGLNSQKSWEELVPNLSPRFISLLNKMTQELPENRPSDTEEILYELEILRAIQEKNLKWKDLPVVLTFSFLISLFWIGIRLTGLLQPFELAAYDIMLQLRPRENPDPRLEIITVSDEDVEYQDAQGFLRESDDQSLSTDALLAIMRKLYRDPDNGPSIVGVDILYDYAQGFPPEYTEGVRLLGADKDLIYICSRGGGNQPAIRSPYGIPESSIGFNDGEADEDGSFRRISRRHLIEFNNEGNPLCKAGYAFSTLVSLAYLSTQNKPAGVGKDKFLKINDVSLIPLKSRSGGYQNLNPGLNHIMTHYRALEKTSDIGNKQSLRSFLEHDGSTDKFRNKIVLIGVIRNDTDIHSTPLDSETHGIFIQAHEISQLISLALDGRALLYPWELEKDLLWITVWGIMSGLAVWLCQSRKYSLRWLVGYLSAFFLTLSLCCYCLLIMGTWVAYLPPMITILSNSYILPRRNYLVHYCKRIASNS